MIKGCCDGLVCATSLINPNYGVCISGEGDQVAVTSQLVVPESDGVMAQLAAELAEAEADGAEGAQVIEARQSAQDTRRSKHRTRKDSQTEQEALAQGHPPGEQTRRDHDDLYGPARDVRERGRVLCHDRGLPGDLLRQQEWPRLLSTGGRGVRGGLRLLRQQRGLRRDLRLLAEVAGIPRA